MILKQVKVRRRQTQHMCLWEDSINGVEFVKRIDRLLLYPNWSFVLVKSLYLRIRLLRWSATAAVVNFRNNMRKLVWLWNGTKSLWRNKTSRFSLVTMEHFRAGGQASLYFCVSHYMFIHSLNHSKKIRQLIFLEQLVLPACILAFVCFRICLWNSSPFVQSSSSFNRRSSQRTSRAWDCILDCF